jgi:hypothetical protein
VARRQQPLQQKAKMEEVAAEEEQKRALLVGVFSQRA